MAAAQPLRRGQLVWELSEAPPTGLHVANVALGVTTLTNRQPQAQGTHVQGRVGAVHPPPHAAPPQRGHATQQRQQQQQRLPPGTAARLNAQLTAAREEQPASLRAAVLDSSSCSGGEKAGNAGEAGLRRRLGGLVLRVGDMLQPQGEAPGDATWYERTADVLTSLPFLAVGWHMHRQRLTPEGRHHARSMMAVGAAATLYHATSGKARRWARKVDYWTIAYSSSTMIKCLFADSPATRRAANLSLLAVPFKPFAVSAANALVMQTEFARQAASSKAVRQDLKRHYVAAALGMGAFFAEDLVMDSGFGGFVHAAWHCLACYGVHTMNGLLAHKERLHLQRHLSASGASPGIGANGPSSGKPLLRRPLHSSASSLPSYGASSAKLGGGWSPPALASP